jgi:hypothetical protein
MVPNEAKRHSIAGRSLAKTWGDRMPSCDESDSPEAEDQYAHDESDEPADETDFSEIAAEEKRLDILLNLRPPDEKA